MSDNLTVLDHKKAIQQVSGNKQLADDLLQMLIKELPDYKHNIQQSLENGTKEELDKILHKMHGGLRYVGAPALTQVVSNTRSELLTINKTQLEQAIELICRECDRVIKQGNYSVE